MKGDNTELSIRTVGRLTTEDEFNDLIVKEDEGGNVRLRDLGYAQLGAENERTILKWNNIPMVGVVLDCPSWCK